jgi:hypothetical protein
VPPELTAPDPPLSVPLLELSEGAGSLEGVAVALEESVEGAGATAVAAVVVGA